MKKVSVVFIALIAILGLASSKSYSQEWNKEQKELWSVVEKNWVAWSEANSTKLLSNLHDRYQGWDNMDPLPVDKAGVEKFMKKISGKFTNFDYDVQPARITVVDNVGVVNYYARFSFLYGDDKKFIEHKAKTVEFYVKKGNAWLLIGDFSSYMEEDENHED